MAVLGSAELVLRLAFPIVRTATLPEGMIEQHVTAAGFRHDPDLYWTWGMLPSPAMQINQFGFRRTEPMTLEKPEGTLRVVTFGDSQTLGAGVGPDQTYSAFAEQSLGEGWEVLNAGISGYRSLNVYRKLQLDILQYQPDAVVIDCFPFDSPRDDGPLVQKERFGTARQRRHAAIRGLLWNSRLFRAVELAVFDLRPDKPRWLDQPDPELGRGDLGYGNHAEIATWGLKHGVTVLFMEYPVSNERWQHSCMTQPGELPEGVPVVPACQAMAESGVPAREMFQDRNHMTEQGNRLVGEVLAESLREILCAASTEGPCSAPAD